MQRSTSKTLHGEDNIFVVVATTANITLNDEQNVDSIDLLEGDHVLVWKQTDETENGIYQVRAGADWKLIGNIGLVAVRFGSQYKESMFALIEADTYKQVSGAPSVINVRVASTANVSPTGALSMDGVTLATDDLVLLKNQTTAADRAVWKVNTAGAWTKQTQPPIVTVTSGTLSSGCAFFLSAANTYTGLGAFLK